jgi:phage terminase large subunit
MAVIDSWLVQWLMQSKARYKVVWGGRGGGKSIAVADALITLATQRKIGVLCCRETKGSMDDSVHTLLLERMEALGFSSLFTSTNEGINCKNGSFFKYKGLLDRGVQAVKGVQGITHCWIEEGQCVSSYSWEILKPSIRGKAQGKEQAIKNAPEIWVSMNPELESNAIYTDFFNKSWYVDLEAPENAKIQYHQADNALLIKANWDSNPYFPDILNEERLRCLRNNPQGYEHIWEGACRVNSDAVVFKGKYKIEAFKPRDEWGQPYYGLDFGFSNDPLAFVKCYVHADCLYIDAEFYKTKIEINDIVGAIKSVDPVAINRPVLADSARPDLISYLKCNGLPFVKGAKKTVGSKNYVQDSVAFLLNFKQIIIQPHCTNSIKEFSTYSYKTDRYTNDILTKLEDANNHLIDAIRYALNELMIYDGSYWYLFDRIGDDLNEAI